MKALQVLVYYSQIIIEGTIMTSTRVIPSGERSNSTKTKLLTSIALGLSLLVMSKRGSRGRRCYNSSAWMAADRERLFRSKLAARLSMMAWMLGRQKTKTLNIGKELVIEWSIIPSISLAATSEIRDGQIGKRVKRGSRGVDQSRASDKQ